MKSNKNRPHLQLPDAVSFTTFNISLKITADRSLPQLPCLTVLNRDLSVTIPLHEVIWTPCTLLCNVCDYDRLSFGPETQKFVVAELRVAECRCLSYAVLFIMEMRHTTKLVINIRH